MSVTPPSPSTTAGNSSSYRDENATVSTQIYWFWGGIFLVSIPMLVPYLLNMWHLEHYRFFPFVFLAVGYLAYNRIDQPLREPRTWWARGCLVLSLLFVVAAAALRSPWFASIGFVLIAIAFLGSQSGPEDRSLIGLAVPLLLLVRLPLASDQLLVIRLQEITTRLTSVVLDLVAVPHAVQANVIQLASRELFVAEACSGIQSVFTLAFVACLFIAVQRRRLWLLPAYLFVAILLAVAGNVVRVSTVALAEQWFQYDLASGWQHELLGYATLLMAISFLWSFDYVIVSLFHVAPEMGADPNPLVRLWNAVVDNRPLFGNSEEIGYSRPSRPEVDEDIRTETRFLRHAPTRAVQYSFLAIACCLTVASVVAAFSIKLIGGEEGGGFMTDEMLLTASPDFFDETLQQIKVVSHEQSRHKENPRLGNNADVWTLEVNGYQGQLVLSQTYLGWHELCLCYEIADWKLLNREVINDQEFDQVAIADDRSIGAFARFQQQPSREGYLFYAAVNAQGDLVEPPALPGRLGSRLAAVAGQELEPMVMLQLWITTNSKLEPAVLKSARDDFFRALNKVAHTITAGQLPEASESRNDSPLAPQTEPTQEN